MADERLQKALARAGVGSRRGCESLIVAGRVMVNGQVVHELGSRVDLSRDEVVVDGVRVEPPTRRAYVMLHKPVGVVSTADDPHGRQTVVEMLDLPERVFPVGRLDANSEGLILLTNDGALTHHLTHPRFEIDKEYHVLLDGYPQERILQQWRAGVVLEGTRTAPATVERLPLREVEAGRAAGRRMERGAWMRVVIHEGRKRHIREVAKLLGHQVERLIRVREGTLVLGDLAPGKWRFLTPDEIANLHSHTRLST